MPPPSLDNDFRIDRRRRLHDDLGLDCISLKVVTKLLLNVIAYLPALEVSPSDDSSPIIVRLDLHCISVLVDGASTTTTSSSIASLILSTMTMPFRSPESVSLLTSIHIH
ncbi:hypothetical protein ACLB2K_035354 [Fragaria x ananassa]